jgi:hypothetical protein
MIREHFQYRTTITTILGERSVEIEAAKAGMLEARQAIESVIASDPFFLSTFDPYDPGSNHPVIRRMVDAAYEADVGPMAAVAGTIAWAGAESMKEAGADFGVVDNGGDIALFSDRDLRVGIYAGTGSQHAILLPPQETITGICTSSASIGPSISFGVADAVCVFSDDVSAADAWATSLCNRLTPDDRTALETLVGTRVNGMLALFGEVMISYGRVPEIVPAYVNPALITKGI